jgi:hypothetical protein
VQQFEELMSHVDHFRSRVSAYRKLANESKDEETAGDMYEIANLFNRMADDLSARELGSDRIQERSDFLLTHRSGLQDWPMNTMGRVLHAVKASISKRRADGYTVTEIRRKA